MAWSHSGCDGIRWLAACSQYKHVAALDHQPDEGGIHLSAGNIRDPGHDAFVLELGRAAFLNARLAVVCFDILRVWGGRDAADLYNDPLGGLIKKLETLSKEGAGPGGLDQEALDVLRFAKFHVGGVQPGTVSGLGSFHCADPRSGCSADKSNCG